jgi:formyl-CoA transferase
VAALDGVRVIDLRRYLPGPTPTMLLADPTAIVRCSRSLAISDPLRGAPKDAVNSA